MSFAEVCPYLCSAWFLDMCSNGQCWRFNPAAHAGGFVIFSLKNLLQTKSPGENRRFNFPKWLPQLPKAADGVTEVPQVLVLKQALGGMRRRKRGGVLVQRLAPGTDMDPGTGIGD